MSILEVERSELAGIPAFVADAPGPFTATMVFRVGRADETPPTAGITHLVEHLALPASSRRPVEFNGTIDNLLTSIWAFGEPAAVGELLAQTTERLARLPVERLEVERRILAAEDASRGPGAVQLAFALRFGPVTHGLTGYEEWGLLRVGAAEAAAWAAERFTRGNAVVTLAGEPPDGLELALPDGPPRPPAEPRPIPEVVYPSLAREGPPGGVLLSLLGRRTSAFGLGVRVLAHRLQDRLRYELGLSYDVDVAYIPLTGEVAHVAFTADAVAENVPQLAREALDALRSLAADGPTPDELQHETTESRRHWEDPTELPASLYFAAERHLLGLPFQSNAELQREREEVTPDEVTSVVAAAADTLLAVCPPDVTELPGLHAYPVDAPRRVEGRRFRPSSWRGRRRVELVVGEDGVTIESTEGRRTTARFDDCAVMLREPDGARTLVSDDGFFVHVDPTIWSKGAEAVAAIDARVDDGRVVARDPEHDARAGAVEAVARRCLKRRWVVSDELELLPERLAGDEELLAVAEATLGWKSGLLALTDRRLLFLYVLFKETAVEVPLAAVRSVDRRGVVQARLVVAAGEEHEFADIVPRRMADEIGALVAERIGA